MVIKTRIRGEDMDRKKENEGEVMAEKEGQSRK
jgi:hypothetical protein